MLYILAFTHVYCHFECCIRFDVVLALYQRCSFRHSGQCEGLNTWNERQDWLHVFFWYARHELILMGASP